MIENRNAVRIVELPACKMVSSGAMNDFEIFVRFNEWFTAYSKSHSGDFYPHNFMWSDTDGKMVWNYAVSEIPEDIGGFEVIDFAGGLYAAAISVDADGEDHDKVLDGIKEWVSNSGCFELDETYIRRSIGTITSPESTKEIMGYAQMDLLFPIKIKSV